MTIHGAYEDVPEDVAQVLSRVVPDITGAPVYVGPDGTVARIPGNWFRRTDIGGGTFAAQLCKLSVEQVMEEMERDPLTFARAVKELAKRSPV